MLYVSEWFLILAAYGSGVVMLLGALRLARGQWRQAGDLGLFLLTFWSAYVVAGALVALSTPRQVLRESEAEFFDAIGVTASLVERTPDLVTNSGTLHARGVFLVVAERVFNGSRKVPHHAPPLDLQLQDAAGNLYGADPAATSLLNSGRDPLSNSLFAPGEARTVMLAFDVPASVQRPGVIIRHRRRLTLNRILLGDPEHFWHRNTVILLGAGKPAS